MAIRSILKITLALLPQTLDILPLYDPQRSNDAQAARAQRDHVRRPVALDPLQADEVTPGLLDDAVGVVRAPVEQVEDVGRDDGGEGEEAPVLAEAADAEGLGDDGGEDAEEEAVAEAGEAGDEDEEVRVGDGEGADLGEGEDEGGEDEAPDAVGVEVLGQPVGADACGGCVVLVFGGLMGMRWLEEEGTYHYSAGRGSCIRTGWRRASAVEGRGNPLRRSRRRLPREPWRRYRCC